MDLDFARMGETGLQTSEIQFGTWRFGKETEEGNVEIDEGRAHELLDAYAEAGGRFIDTASATASTPSSTGSTPITSTCSISTAGTTRRRPAR